MIEIEKKRLINFFFKLNYGKLNQIEIIKGGKNSKVYKIISKKKNIIIKQYYGKNCKRIKHEYNFYNYLKDKNIKNIPSPLAYDFKNNLAAFSFLEGKKIKKIKKKHIIQLTNFISSINKKKNLHKIALATEGIKNRENFIRICKKRIEKLKLVDNKSLINKKLHIFLKRKIIPKFKLLNKDIINNDIINNPKFKLTKKDMIISPSDVGFHNIIEKKNKLFFFDFEYAGVDDQIKLICDFYCQPNQIISLKLKNLFKLKIISKYENFKDLDYLVNIFLPINYLKWCCIILNEFIRKKKNIRKHAGQFNQKILNTRLSIAKKYFERYLK